MTAEQRDIRIAWARWPEDTHAVALLFREFYAWLVAEHTYDVPYILEDAAALPGPYRQSGGVCLAYVDGEVAGCLALRPWTEPEPPLGFTAEASTAEAKRMYLRAPYRGLGMGTLLVREVKAAAERAGVGHLLHDSLRSLHDAHRLYLREGFTIIPPYNALPEADVFHMACRLIPAA